MVTNAEMMQLSDTWIRILNKINAMDKCPKNFGSGDLLFFSEIHTIMAIGRHSGINVTELARFMGISKSATSQMISRLLRKNLIEKSQNPQNNKEINIRLSAKGMIAYHGHELHHAKMCSRITEKLGPVSDDQLQFLIRFLQAIEETSAECI